MSGICGIFHLDGKKVEEKLLLEFTQHLKYRGSDSQKIWLNDYIGFGHTLFKTTFESNCELQPFSLDNQVFIVADARIDDRQNLLNKLNFKQENNTNQLTDVELILRAYLTWDESCLDHLLGDFSFAIFDSRKKRLFCARDHFGIKPFFYTQFNQTFLFASDLQTLLKHPNICLNLKQLFIADFLIFNTSLDQSNTVYDNIYRLPASHQLIINLDKMTINRYYTLPLNQEIKYKNQADYIEHYQELLTVAIQDRLRFDQVNILMSGGIDSTSIAAIANQFTKIKAFNETVKTLFKDEEIYYAQITANFLGIDIEYFYHDNYQLYDRWQELYPNFSEPSNSPFAAESADFIKLFLSHSPICLSGLGGDEVLYAHRLYYVELIKNGQILQFWQKLRQHWQFYGTFRGLAFRSGLKQLLGLNIDSNSKPLYPSWIKPEFTKKLDLKERFAHYTQPKPLLHKTHPEAYQGLTSGAWSSALESSSYPYGLEIRYPFFDLRLINYILAIEPIPWCFNKHIHRSAIAKLLPSEIVNRPKTPLQGDQFWCRVNQFNDLDKLNLDLKIVSELYIDKNKYLQSLNNYQKQQFDHNYFSTAPISLEYWLLSREMGCWGIRVLGR